MKRRNPEPLEALPGPRSAGLICFRNEWVDLTVDGSGSSGRSRPGRDAAPTESCEVVAISR